MNVFVVVRFIAHSKGVYNGHCPASPRATCAGFPYYDPVNLKYGKLIALSNAHQMLDFNMRVLVEYRNKGGNDYAHYRYKIYL